MNPNNSWNCTGNSHPQFPPHPQPSACCQCGTSESHFCRFGHWNSPSPVKPPYTPYGTSGDDTVPHISPGHNFNGHPPALLAQTSIPSISNQSQMSQMGHSSSFSPYGPIPSSFIGPPASASPYESSPGGPSTSISPPQPGLALGSLPLVAWPMLRNNQPRVSQASPVPVNPSRPIVRAKRDRNIAGLDDGDDLRDETLQPSDSTNNREQSSGQPPSSKSRTR